MTIGFNMFLESYPMQQILSHMLLSQNQWTVLNLKRKLKFQWRNHKAGNSAYWAEVLEHVLSEVGIRSFLLQSHGVHQVKMAKEATSPTRDNSFLEAQILINGL